MPVANQSLLKLPWVQSLATSGSLMTQPQCRGVKTKIDGQLAAGTLQKDQSYADAWLSGVSTWKHSR